MILQNPLKQLAAFILLSTVAIGFQSCSDDDDAPTKDETLVSITAASDVLSDGYRGFIFLSDENGKVIVYKEYKNGESFTLTAPDFKGEKFYLTEGRTHQNNDGEARYFRLSTFVDIERGKEWVLGSTAVFEDGTTVGDANLTFTNVGAGMYNGSTNGASIYGISDEDTQDEASLAKTPSLLYMTRDNDGQYTYNVYENIVVGNNTIDLSTVNKTMSELEVDLPEGIEYMESYVRATPKVGGFLDEDYYIGSFDGNGESYKIRYPGNAFAAYYVKTEFETEAFAYERVCDIKDFSLPSPNTDVDITASSGAITYSASGNIDMLKASHYSEDGFYAIWDIYLPKTSASATIPKIERPAELATLDMPATQLYTYNTIDFGNFENYQAVISSMRTSTYGASGLFLPGSNYLDVYYIMPNPGGRIKTNRTFGRADK